MAAIAKAAVSLYPVSPGSSERYVGGVKAREVGERRLQITGVTAADTATADVLGFSELVACGNAVYDTSVATVAVDPVNNGIIVGAGPSNKTLYLTVTGVVKTTP